tara:strand:- start:468 stop:641 length:174 start_codon:yes stop_codon:yes gene_type:complete
MSKEKAIEIYKNLEQTIEKMGKSAHIEHKRETYEIPRARKSKLIKIKNKLIEKYGKM